MPLISFVACRAAGVLSAAVFAFALSACSPDAPAEAPAINAVASDDADETMTDVRTAVAQQNFGDAASKAKAAQDRYPADPRVHLLAAEVEARLGNAGNAVAAFRRALDSGLEDPIEALSLATFDPVRNSEPFTQLQADLVPGRMKAAAKTPPRASESVRMGDVEIITDPTGDYIRAGDIVLDTRP